MRPVTVVLAPTSSRALDALGVADALTEAIADVAPDWQIRRAPRRRRWHALVVGGNAGVGASFPFSGASVGWSSLLVLASVAVLLTAAEPWHAAARPRSPPPSGHTSWRGTP